MRIGIWIHRCKVAVHVGAVRTGATRAFILDPFEELGGSVCSYTRVPGVYDIGLSAGYSPSKIDELD